MSGEFSKESVIRRIAALMEKTTANGCTEAEALAASKKVGEMLNQYNMSLSDIKLRNSDYIHHKFDTRTKSEQPIWRVCWGIKYFTDTKCWETSYGGTFNGRIHNFFGMDVDVQVATYLYDMLQRAMLYGYEDYRKTIDNHAQLDGSTRNRIKNGFYAGMAQRLNDRLREMKDAQNEYNKSTGRDLVVLKREIVDEEFKALSIKLSPSKGRVERVDGKAYMAGCDAADKVAINQGVCADQKKEALV